MSQNRVGRPPQAGISDALISAAESVMTSQGYSALTIDALVTVVGTTRPTFYRRYSSVAHLALEVIINRFGTGLEADNGNLMDDLIELQRAEVEMFRSHLMRRNLPGLLESIRLHPDVAESYFGRFIAPRRENVLRVLELARARGEISESRDEDELACDLLLGPVLARAIVPTGVGLDDALAVNTARAVVHHLAAQHSRVG